MIFVSEKLRCTCACLTRRLAKVPRLFKDLYDKDIIDEESFVSWGEKPSKKYVSKELSQKIHEKAAKFIGWLKVRCGRRHTHVAEVDLCSVMITLNYGVN